MQAMSPRRQRKTTGGVSHTRANPVKMVEKVLSSHSVATRSSMKKKGALSSPRTAASSTRSLAVKKPVSPRRTPVKDKTVIMHGRKSPSTPTTSHSASTRTRTPTLRPLTRTTPLRESPRSVGTRLSIKSSPSTPNKTAQRAHGETPSTPRSMRRRLMSSPEKSPQTLKSRKSRECKRTVVQVKEEPKSEDDCTTAESILPSSEETGAHLLPVECHVKCEDAKDSSSPVKKTQAESSLPADPELSGRFLRRKWFSLKTRGGFTCLRSAILSPEEIAQEVIQHTMVYTPKAHEANFFTTKLMVRLSSRLPPTRARPSCEELVELINSKQRRRKFDPLKQPKGEGTAIRVKVERRSFTDTISHVTSNSPKPEGSPTLPQRNAQSRLGRGPVQAQDELTKMKEREIALKQLQNMRYWRGGQYRY